MNYHDIKHDDMNNGDGIRVTLFVSGCEHHCKGCQNPQTWDYHSGIEFDESAKEELFSYLDRDYIAGLTLTGGDPFAPYNRLDIFNLVKEVKSRYPHKTIWVYTGYTFERLLYEANFYVTEVLKECDVLVDGRFIESRKDVTLKWRGSSNQRVLLAKEWFKKGRKVLYCD